MSLQRYGSVNLRDQSSLQLSDSTSSHYIAFQAPSSVAANITFQVPGTDTTNGAMVSDGSGHLSLALIANANISGSAAIAYSKLNLSGSIVNADINAAAAIAYSKLNLSGSIVNADIAAGAAIAFSKLAALTSANILVGNGSNVATSVSVSGDLTLANTGAFTIAAGAVTASKLGAVTDGITLDQSGAGSTLEVKTGGISNTQVNAAAAIAVSKLAAGSNGQVLETVSGVPTWSNVTLVSSFKSNWITADGTTKTITHSLGSVDVIVQIYDKTDGSTIEVDSVVRTDANTLTVTASSAPPAAGWRVLILAI